MRPHAGGYREPRDPRLRRGADDRDGQAVPNRVRKPFTKARSRVSSSPEKADPKRKATNAAMTGKTARSRTFVAAAPRARLLVHAWQHAQKHYCDTDVPLSIPVRTARE